MFTFHEFFAGGGMARAGLGSTWKCLFANDFDRKKAETYRDNWGDGEIVVGDIRTLSAESIRGCADLAWGSFPCQDLSLAGGGAGLKGDRSGTFWPFFKHMGALIEGGRAPKIIALENVVGTLTSHGGKDFAAICGAFRNVEYRCGAVVIDAALFVPQSRPRLFVIGVCDEVELPHAVSGAGPSQPWHTASLQRAHMTLSPELKANWLWWRLPVPEARKEVFAELIEESPDSVAWHSPAETAQLLAMMSPVNLRKVEAAKKLGRRSVGTIYKRTRVEHGVKHQRAEVRFDDIAGCLRTPAGGSSRQLILVVDGEKVRSRLISSRETARLMGLEEGYRLPGGYNEAYHLTGDGVAVQVVTHIARHIFEPILAGVRQGKSAA